MGLATSTIEMRSPEEHRERLHELVKAARTVMVLHGAATASGIDGQPMVMVRTGDDTTMYAAAAIDAAHDPFANSPRVTVAVPCEESALFTAEAIVSRDRGLIDLLWRDAWRRWFRSKSDPALAVVIMTPIEGSYWERAVRHSYLYRLMPQAASREPVSDGVPVEV